MNILFGLPGSATWFTDDASGGPPPRILLFRGQVPLFISRTTDYLEIITSDLSYLNSTTSIAALVSPQIRLDARTGKTLSTSLLLF